MRFIWDHLVRLMKIYLVHIFNGRLVKPLFGPFLHGAVTTDL